MTVNEIFSDLSAHMIKGLMIHSQLADYYWFLGLPNYAECHENHYKSESCNWRKLSNYYITHFNKLIEEKEIDNPYIIPQDWINYTRQDVDANTKRKGVENGMKHWVDWEVETKNLFETHFSNLMELGECSAAMFIKCFMCDVDNELADAQAWHLHKKATNFDINYMISEQ